MKSKMMKRTIALLLCMVMVLSNGSYALADETITEEAAVEAVADDTVVTEEPAVEEPAPAPEVPVETPVETPTEAPVEETTTPEAEVTPEETTTEETAPVVETEVSEETVTEKTEETVTEKTEETEEVQTEEKTETREESQIEELKDEHDSSTEIEKEDAVETVVENEIVLQTEVKGTVIKMTGPKSSFPEGKEYSILATELTLEQENDVEVALRKMELEQETKVVSYQAYDIKLLVDGEEAQPLGEVKVTFEGGAVEEKVDGAETVEVYHIDETVQEAKPITNEINDNTVEMTTDHFSTYVITITTQKDVTVTVEHYHGKKQLYRTRKYPLTFETKLEEIAVITTHYNVARIVKFDENNNEVVLYRADNTDNITDIKQVLEANAKYRVYYEPTASTEVGGVQMFDYQVDTGDYSNKVSINDSDNYSSDSDSDQRFLVGSWQHGLDSATNKDGTNINQFYDNTGATATIGKNGVLGIITGVNYQTGALQMATGTNGQLYEPGLFTRDAKIGKQVLTGYDLQFTRNGDAYELRTVIKNGTPVENGQAGADFFPLDSLMDSAGYPQENKSNDKNHNYYFGMRYDISFEIGEYVGDLTYEFSGDDDLWVVLDAEDNGGEVVVDVGGIHRAITKSVDLWEYLDPDGGADLRTKPREELSQAELEVLNKEHTLTILYMERGAGDSNCTMKFILPNSRIVDPIVNNVNFKLNLEKTISGLTAAEFDALKEKLVFKVTTTNNGVQSTNGYAIFDGEEKEIKANATGWTWSVDEANQTYIGTYTLNNENSYINQFEYTVTEYEEVVSGYEVGTWVATDGGDAREAKQATIKFSAQSLTKEIAYTNNYTPTTTDIDITKIWKDAGNAYGTRPSQISFTLQWRCEGDAEWQGYDSDDEGTETDIYVMQKDNHVDPINLNIWKYKVVGLPIQKDGKSIEYKAVEIVEKGSAVDKYYVSTTTDATTMVNEFDIEIIKVSSSENGYSGRMPLEGAVFVALQQGGTTYYGKSEANGRVVWYTGYADGELSGTINMLPDGYYGLSEIKAPTGYMVSTEVWNIRVIDGVLAVPLEKFNPNNVTKTYDENDNVVKKIYSVYFENTPLYELPSTGSIGIYCYMVTGTMLMITATVIKYKNRRKEVLERVNIR